MLEDDYTMRSVREKYALMEEKQYWYHGDPSLRTSFRDQRMDRDPSADDLYNGPGIYFTEDPQEAQKYAEPEGYIYKVELDGNIITNDRGLSMEEVDKLIRWMPEEKKEELLEELIDDLQYDYEEEDEIIEAAHSQLKEYLQEKVAKYSHYANNNFLAPSINIYKEFYGNDNAEDFTNSLVSLGIDGIQVSFDGRQHAVIYNPKIIDIWETISIYEFDQYFYGEED